METTYREVNVEDRVPTGNLRTHFVLRKQVHGKKHLHTATYDPFNESWTYPDVEFWLEEIVVEKKKRETKKDTRQTFWDDYIIKKICADIPMLLNDTQILFIRQTLKSSNKDFELKAKKICKEFCLSAPSIVRSISDSIRMLPL